MPPPATIYGHICSAVGDWLDPRPIQFGYCFEFVGKGSDLEHIHVTTVSSGKLDKGWGFVKNIEAEINPTEREVLLHPKMTLYVNSQDSLQRFYEAFRSPHYPVALGRSQDLSAYKNVSLIELESAHHGYYEKTLLPWSFRPKTSVGISVLMPKFINPRDRTQVAWERYVLLEHRILYPPQGMSYEGVRVMLRYDGDGPVWIDPESPEVDGMKRIVTFHEFIIE
jgi:CRISPR-associated protein Cas5t